MKLNASNDRCPPESSLNYFLIPLKWTWSSAPNVTSEGSIKLRWAVAPGSKSLNIEDKFILTSAKHFYKVFVLLSSN